MKYFVTVLVSLQQIYYAYHIYTFRIKCKSCDKSIVGNTTFKRHCQTETHIRNTLALRIRCNQLVNTAKYGPESVVSALSTHQGLHSPHVILNCTTSYESNKADPDFAIRNATGMLTSERNAIGMLTTERNATGMLTTERNATGMLTTERNAIGMLTTERNATGMLTTERNAIGMLTTGMLTTERNATGMLTTERNATGMLTTERNATGMLTTERNATGMLTTERNATSGRDCVNLVGSRTSVVDGLRTDKGLNMEYAVGSLHVSENLLKHVQVPLHPTNNENNSTLEVKPSNEDRIFISAIDNPIIPSLKCPEDVFDI